MFCPHCGHENIDDARYCARCGKEIVQKVDTPVPPSQPAPEPPPLQPQPRTHVPPSIDIQPVEYAGFWLRFIAFLIDAIVLFALDFVLTLVTFGGYVFMFGVPVIISWLYYALMESSEKQATLGKLAVGLAVTDCAHRRISFARATGRHFAKWISAVLMFIGYLMIGFTAKKQGLHDMLADTLVVKR